MGLFSSIVGVADSLTGGWLSDSGTKSSAKRQYKYNERLQDADQDFQKYMAENAHQMEMEDLKRAGLNPALTTTGSSAGSIAGSSSGQSAGMGNPMADLSSIVQNINATRMTNADVKLKEAQANALDNQVDKNEGGIFGSILGSSIGSGLTGEIKKAAQNWKKTSAKRQEKLKKRNKNESYWNKLTTFEIKKHQN